MSENLQAELETILHGAAVAVLDDRAFLRVTGADAARWLNGMVTNSVQALAPGEGCYAFLLNAQGRILGDCTIYREPGEPPAFVLATSKEQVEAIQKHLDHFIIMDDVGLRPVYARYRGLMVLGPEASRMLSALGLSLPERNHYVVASSVEGPIAVLCVAENEFELRADEGQIDALRERLNLPEISAAALEALRLLEGRPLYGREITGKYLAQETNLPQALHFNKGCYLGQEIVERIRSRGQVHRLLTPLRLAGSLPTEFPAPLEADGKPVGEITSAAVVPLPEGEQILGLGYVRREALDTRADLHYAGGTAVPRSASNDRLLISKH